MRRVFALTRVLECWDPIEIEIINEGVEKMEKKNEYYRSKDR